MTPYVASTFLTVPLNWPPATVESYTLKMTLVFAQVRVSPLVPPFTSTLGIVIKEAPRASMSMTIRRFTDVS